MTYSERHSMDSAWPVRSVFTAGVAGALVDAAYFSGKALLMGQSPIGVLQSIAAFWLGDGAFSGGLPSAAFGAATHLGLATAMAAGFLLARSRARFFRGPPIQSGVAYGLFLYLAMYLVVLPIRWPSLYPQFDGWNSVQDIAAHLAVGVTFAYYLRNDQI